MSRAYRVALAISSGLLALAIYWYGPIVAKHFHGSPRSESTAVVIPLPQQIAMPIADSVGVSQSRAMRTLPLASVDTAVNEFLQSTSLVETHSKLARMGTPQALFVMAHIQDLCRRVALVEQDGIADPREYPILGTDNLDLRQQAQARLRERSSRKLCAKFPSELLTDQSVKGAFERASSAGDLRAKLRRLEDRLLAERTALPTGENALSRSMPAEGGIGIVPTLLPADVSLLRAAFESKDPIAMRAAGPLLAGLYRDVDVSFGSLSGPVDGVIGDAVWRLLACKYGGGCDASSTELTEACLLNSRCGDSTLQDYLARYVLTASQMQDAQTIVDRFQASIDGEDWAFLQVRPSTGPRFDRTPFPPESRPFILRP